MSTAITAGKRSPRKRKGTLKCGWCLPGSEDHANCRRRINPEHPCPCPCPCTREDVKR